MNDITWDIIDSMAVPLSGMLLFAGKKPPKGFAFCDGRELSRVEYPQLFKRIGTKFGEGDGSTTFNLPNIESQIPDTRYIMQIGFSLTQFDELEAKLKGKNTTPSS